MKITCDVKSLRAALETVNRAVSQKTTMPILANVRLIVAAEGSAIEATNLEFAVRAAVAGLAVDRPGTCLLPAALTMDVLRSAPGESLAIEADGDSVRIEGPSAEWEFPTADPDLYPQLPGFPAGPCLTLAAADFLRCVRRSVHAAEDKSAQFALGGCLAEYGPTSFGLTATDGRRLAHCEVPATGELTSDENHQSVIPARTLRDIAAILDESGDPVDVAFPDPSWCHVRQGGLVVSSRLLSGRFPRWRLLIPAMGKAAGSVPVAAGALRDAIERAALVTVEMTRGVDFAFGSGRLTLAGTGDGKGRSKVIFPLDYGGPDLVVEVNPQYLTGALKVFDADDTLTLEVIDADSPLTLRSDGFFHLAMPMTRDRAGEVKS